MLLSLRYSLTFPLLVDMPPKTNDENKSGKPQIFPSGRPTNNSLATILENTPNQSPQRSPVNTPPVQTRFLTSPLKNVNPLSGDSGEGSSFLNPSSAAANVASAVSRESGSSLDPISKDKELYIPSSQGSAESSSETVKMGVRSPTKTQASPAKPSEDRDKWESIFKGKRHFEDVQIYKENIHESLTRYHEEYDPLVALDPLFDYGSSDGSLPGRTDEETMSLRDILLRLYSPRTDCMWDDLPSAIDEFMKYQFTVDDLVSFNSGGITHYYLHKEQLVEIAHIILALNQVLENLAFFFYKGKKSTFDVDPDYKLTQIMAGHYQEKEIILTGPILQRRCQRGFVHVT